MTEQINSAFEKLEKALAVIPTNKGVAAGLVRDAIKELVDALHLGLTSGPDPDNNPDDTRKGGG
jgi:hypothetical protein